MTLSPEVIALLGAIGGGAIAGLAANQANNRKVDQLVDRLIALELRLLEAKAQRNQAMEASALLQWPDLGSPLFPV